MNVVEPLADFATGAVSARAIEPDTGVDATGHTTERNCLNCSTPLVGDYCHACGQHGHVHRSLGAFGHDLLHGVFHFEGKIWRTLPLLAWRPGALTRRYIEGQRASYVSPLALFLFSVFLMFAVFGWTGGIGLGAQTQANMDDGLTESLKETDQKIVSLQKDRAEQLAAGKSVTELDRELKETRDEASMLRLMKQRGITEATMIRGSDDVHAPLWIEKAYRKASANPKLLLYKLQNSAYKFSWALIPISVPFLWLLFPFSRRFRLYDHTVFVTYSLCFMTLLAVVLDLLYAAGAGGFVPIAAVLIPPVHMYLQLRGAYQLRWWSALLRTVLLVVFATVAAALFGLLLLTLGVLG